MEGSAENGPAVYSCSLIFDPQVARLAKLPDKAERRAGLQRALEGRPTP